MVLFISFPTHLYSSLVMDRQSISLSVYNNNDEFDATKNNFHARMQAQLEEIKALIKSYKRSSSSSRRRSRAQASELPSPARSHRHRHQHRQEHEGQEINTNNRSTSSPSLLASSPSDFKASSPTDIRHLTVHIEVITNLIECFKLVVTKQEVDGAYEHRNIIHW